MRALTLSLALPLLLLATSGPAKPVQPEKLSAKDQATLDKTLAGLIPGRAESCIPLRPSGALERVGDSIFLFRVSPSLVYRNDIAGRCSGGANSTPVMKSYNSQYCRGDIVNMVDLQIGMQQGTCVLGDFTPYRKPAKK